jgi:uncharacterized protein (DUF2249 family)
LADEHAVLRSQVASRADAVLSAIGAGDWPAAELRALTGYFRAEVLQQADAEEWHLFPPQSSARFTRLSHDHARLRYVVEALECAGDPEAGRAPGHLAATVRALLTQLDHHFRMEEQVLAQAGRSGTAHAVPAASRRSHKWYPLTEGTVIDLDALPDEQAVDATVDRLLRLARGAQVGLRSHRDVLPVWRRMNQIDPGGYGFVYLEGGPPLWSVQVTRRARR